MSHNRITAIRYLSLVRMLVVLAAAVAAAVTTALPDATAQQPTAELLSGVSHDTVALISWRTDADPSDLRLLYEALGWVNPNRELPELLERLANSGVLRAASIISLNDIAGGRPGRIVIVDTGTASAPDVGEELRELIVPRKPDDLLVTEPWSVPQVTTWSNTDNLDARNAAALREQFAAAFAQMGDRKIQFVLAAGPDQRRVLSEFLPAILHELRQSTGREIDLPNFDVAEFSNKFRWLALGIDAVSDSEPDFHVIVSMADENTARELGGFAPVLYNYLAELLKDSKPLVLQAAREMAPAATVDGTIVNIRLAGSQNALRNMLKALNVEADSLSIKQDLRNLVIAFHNYHDAWKHLPTIGSRDDHGQPLLSWRVHILPFINQSELYEEFHLDEPWDSPHNKQLVGKMPGIFQAKRSNIPIDKGLSNYLMPCGNGAIFGDFEKRKFEDISDGMSHTAMLVEVTDDEAEIWTKPGGWTFDPENPSRELGGHIEGRLHIGRVDGSVVVLPANYQSIRELMTAAAGDKVD